MNSFFGLMKTVWYFFYQFNQISIFEVVERIRMVYVIRSKTPSRQILMHIDLKSVKNELHIFWFLTILFVVNFTVDLEYNIVQTSPCVFLHIVKQQKLSARISLHLYSGIFIERYLYFSYLLESHQVVNFYVGLFSQNCQIWCFWMHNAYTWIKTQYLRNRLYMQLCNRARNDCHNCSIS